MTGGRFARHESKEVPEEWQGIITQKEWDHPWRTQDAVSEYLWRTDIARRHKKNTGVYEKLLFDTSPEEVAERTHIPYFASLNNGEEETVADPSEDIENKMASLELGDDLQSSVAGRFDEWEEDRYARFLPDAWKDVISYEQWNDFARHGDVEARQKWRRSVANDFLSRSNQNDPRVQQLYQTLYNNTPEEEKELEAIHQEREARNNQPQYTGFRSAIPEYQNSHPFGYGDPSPSAFGRSNF